MEIREAIRILGETNFLSPLGQASFMAIFLISLANGVSIRRQKND
jgi:hypothetical protein